MEYHLGGEGARAAGETLASLQTQKTGCDSFGGTLAACAVLPSYERAEIVNFKRGGSAYFCRL